MSKNPTKQDLEQQLVIVKESHDKLLQENDQLKTRLGQEQVRVRFLTEVVDGIASRAQKALTEMANTPGRTIAPAPYATPNMTLLNNLKALRPELYEEARALNRSGLFIDAIKKIRYPLNLGLKDAKDLNDAIRAEMAG